MIALLRRRGMTLIEVLVASVVFVVIFMGMASCLQSSIIMSQAGIGVSEIMRHYRDGMRLLLEGDNDPISSDPQRGLWEARQIWVVVGNGRVRYQAGDDPGESYELQILNGQLRRQRVSGPVPRPVKILIGDFPTAAPSQRVLVSPDTTSLSPLAIILPGGSPSPLPVGSAAVRFNLTLFNDLDNDQNVSGNEMVVSFTPVIYLRNSEQ